MSRIKNVMVQDKVVQVPFPELDGFIVDIVFLSRDRLMKIRNEALVNKFNRRTRKTEEEVDNDKFLAAYAKAVINGWVGLTYENLSKLLPIELSAVDPQEEIPYDPEDALMLLKNSTIFDQFITDTMNDFEVFEQGKREENTKN